MKRTFATIIASLCLMGTAQAQDSGQNYVMKRTMLNTSATSYVDNIQYYDGLGRPFQSVERAYKSGTQTGSILATLQEYDTMGRESDSWLPVSITGSYLAPSSFKSQAPGNYGSDARPYSQSVYESSPLDRLTESYRPGSAWSNKPAKMEYLLNTTSSPLNCIRYSVSSADALVNNGNYAKSTLRVTKATDEDGKVLYTFTDKQGQKLLVRAVNGSETLDTYYVYDDYGCLRFVLQPEYQTTASLDQYAFQYKYDDHDNCIWKKLPGIAYVTYEYDSADRMIFSQDGNQRTSGKWTFYVYDSLGRLTQQGENTTKAAADSGVYLQNYYDNYTSLRSAVSSNSNYPDDTSGYSRGFLTGTMTRVFGTDTKLYTAFYYDIEGRVTKKVQQNMLGGYDITTTTYSFSGKPLTVTRAHTATGKTSRTEVYTYTYDEKDRVSTVKHKLGSTEVTLASYTYDTLGRQSTKKLHGSSTNQLTYSYNIQNWLTSISSSKFTQTLGYGSDYNGNISTMNWNANGSNHSYSFTYDGVNRLLNATHGTDAYTEKVTKYDKNGNIMNLRRYGNGLIDDLSYTYNGNQLTRVEDATGNTAGFSNGASTANEYTYDNNGNLTKDSNKNIFTIAYNVLNLPSKVTFTDGSTITYSYAADGTKLRTVHTISGTTTTKDYCANVVYENGVQKMLLTEEGYVDLSNSTYYYYLKDHQGNNRVVINSSGTVQETNHYYPFGGVFASTGNVQPYKYNGKELDTKKSLNWYDYGARHYDAALGRWFVVDPLAEKMSAWSPYAYCFNNPIRFVDPNGQDGIDVVAGYVIGLITNTLPNTGFIRDSYTPTDVSDYNNVLRSMDNASISVGKVMVAGGGGAMIAGETMTATGVALTVGSAGSASAVSVPTAVSGVVVTEAGAITIASGINMMNNAQQNRSGGYDRGKKSNVSSGNKNSKHANPKAKSSAKQNYQEAKKKFDELNKKPNKSPEDKKETDYWKKQMNHWKMKQDFSGENHSRNAKGNR